MLKKLITLTALTATLSACDFVQRAEQRAEQGDRLYRAAMDDYRAGRLDAALKGFEKAAEKDPANASARFQLACLLQDSRRDFVGAYCAYREYLLQQPSSDKAKLAKDRLVACEREVAKELAEKYSLAKAGVLLEEAEALRKSLKEAEAKAAAAESAQADSKRRIDELEKERGRLLAMVKGIGEDEGAKMRGPSVKEVRDLLDEDDDEESPASAPLLLPARDSAVPDEAKAEAEKKKKETEKSAVPARPDEYEVQDGDTLYGIAKRFYGNISAWKRIRDANKALISTDGRLRTGDVIKLP